MSQKSHIKGIVNPAYLLTKSLPHWKLIQFFKATILSKAFHLEINCKIEHNRSFFSEM